MIPSQSIEDYLTKRDDYFLIDVRSESEFLQGHICGAFNIPVLNDEERKEVGTLYKQIGKEKAVLRGFELAGPKFHEMMKEAGTLANGRKVMVYCWRGGMRSEIFTWLLKMAGLDVCRITGGYKNYRTKTYETVRSKLRLIVMGGATGCGKTVILNCMKLEGFQVLDLEGLANHKGSTYGGIGMPEQPFIEHFENLMAEEIWKMDLQKPIWVENESQLIGKVMLPLEFKNCMVESPFLNLTLSSENRYKNIEKEYANLPKNELIEATKKLEKRLGNLRMRQAVDAIERGENAIWIPILMEYYDKGYNHSVDKLEKDKRQEINIDNLNFGELNKYFLKYEQGN